jgi:hypothetical protein
MTAASTSQLTTVVMRQKQMSFVAYLNQLLCSRMSTWQRVVTFGSVRSGLAVFDSDLDLHLVHSNTLTNLECSENFALAADILAAAGYTVKRVLTARIPLLRILRSREHDTLAVGGIPAPCACDLTVTHNFIYKVSCLIPVVISRWPMRHCPMLPKYCARFYCNLTYANFLQKGLMCVLGRSRKTLRPHAPVRPANASICEV